MDLSLFSDPNYKWDDQATYDLIGSGRTIGCFQIESSLLQTYSKKLKPENIQQLSDLIAIVRPGTLEVTDEETGLSMATLFCERKNGRLKTKPLVPCLEEILRDTFGILVYQESIILICKEIAGFDLKDADSVRKGVGKKDPKLLYSLESKFIEGCKKVGKCDEKDARIIFDAIKKAARYSFNKSHSISYAFTSYITAYLKAHFPKEFFVGWLRHTKNDQDKFGSISELISDAKSFGIDVFGPALYNYNVEFEYRKNGIYFGLSSIREIGEASINKILKVLKEKEEELGDLSKVDWLTFLFKIPISAGPLKALILSGALSYMGVDRQQMLFDLERFKRIPDGPKVGLLETYSKGQFACLGDLIREYLKDPPKTNNRKPTKPTLAKLEGILQELENPPFKLKDSVDFIAYNEELYLGVPITVSKADGRGQAEANCMVRDLAYRDEYSVVSVVLDNVREFRIKKGQNSGKRMAFITASDKSARTDKLVCFSEVYEQFRDILQDGNTVLLRCKKSDAKDKESLLVEKVWQI